MLRELLDPAGAPGPDLRRDVVQDATTRGFCHARKMKVQPRIINQDDEIPGFGLEYPPDRAYPLNHRADGGQPDQSHHVEVRDSRHKRDPCRPHRSSADSDQFGLRVEFPDGLGQIGAVQIAGGLTRHN